MAGFSLLNWITMCFLLLQPRDSERKKKNLKDNAQSTDGRALREQKGEVLVSGLDRGAKTRQSKYFADCLPFQPRDFIKSHRKSLEQM